ncbi:MAG: Rid family hydrolase [Rhodospirillales bacterium]|nr:Rid family hydrolase [Rhodospirillales bacterium]
MTRLIVPFDRSWRMPIPIRVSRAVRVGDLLFTCGQVDLDGHGRPQHPGDLLAQSARAMAHLYAVLEQGGAAAADLAHLHVFYRDGGGLDEAAYRAALTEMVGDGAVPVTVLTPLPTLFYSGVEVEIDAVALAGQGRNARRALGEGGFPEALRAGPMIFAQATAAVDAAGRLRHPADPPAQGAEVLESLKASLAALGAGLGDICKVTVYLDSDVPPAAAAACEKVLRAGFPAPGPVRTTVPLPRLGAPGETLRVEATALQDAAAAGERLTRHPRWASPDPCPWSQGLRCGSLVFAGAQLPLDATGRISASGDFAKDLSDQTHAAMGHLRAVLGHFGADLGDLVKVNTYYRGGADPEALHRNLEIRSGYYADPGPASTGMPLPALAPAGALISIDAVAALP